MAPSPAGQRPGARRLPHPLLLAAVALLPVAAAEYEPAYLVNGFESYPRVPAAGKPWTLVVSVLSDGGPASRGVSLGLWLNPPAGALPCNATPDFSAPLPIIEPGKAFNATFKLTGPAVPAGANSTTATVRAFADYSCEDTFARATPDERQAAREIMVTANPGAWPYLDTAAKLFTLNPGLPAAGVKFDLTTEVCNGGSAVYRANRRYMVGMFLSTPPDWEPSCGDVPNATAVVPSMRVFKLPRPGQAVPPMLKDRPCATVKFKRVVAPSSGSTRAVLALLQECERTKQGPDMAATTNFNQDFLISPSVAAQFKFGPFPGDRGIYSLATPVTYLPFPVMAGGLVTITATLSNIGSMAGKVGVIALWFRPYDGNNWDPSSYRPVGDISGAAATLDYTNRVLRPGQALKVTFANVPTPQYDESVVNGMVNVIMRANALGTTNETLPGMVGESFYLGANL